MVFGSYIFGKYFSVSLRYLVVANLIFFVTESLVLLTIFVYAVKQEEVTDTRTLAKLTNSITRKAKKSMDLERCHYKMAYLGVNLTAADYDRLFRVKLNLLRIEALRFWFSDNHDSNRMMIRLQEVAFYNAGVLT